MTDNEIIKAMQCVIGNDVSCSECEYQKALPFPSCRRMCAKNALDLINRQKDKIKEFDEKLVIQQGLIDYQKEEIERLKKFIEKDQGLILKLTNVPKNEYDNKIKFEAIKEFVGQLKKELSEFDMSSVGFSDYDRGYKDCMTAVEDVIDSLEP